MSKECKEELVSIIIPVYNTPKQFLEECLESIRKQCYKNIEVIIVDDGSKHETASYLDSCQIAILFFLDMFKWFHNMD